MKKILFLSLIFLPVSSFCSQVNVNDNSDTKYESEVEDTDLTDNEAGFLDAVEMGELQDRVKQEVQIRGVSYYLRQRDVNKNCTNEYRQNALQTLLASDAELSVENRLAMLNVLIRNGVNPNAKDEQGNTPVHYAQSNPDVLKELLKYRVDVLSTNNNKSTVFHKVASYGRLQSMEALLDYQADTWARRIKRLVDKGGRSPSPCLSRLSPFSKFYAFARLTTVRFLNGSKDAQGKAPLDILVERRNAFGQLNAAQCDAMIEMFHDNN
ncbi:ankyrin repeat domain-containing protein [Candidatus Dependentiae bacterium]|nr:ankyrin repeat domain-containing protein [Candidatus Dependentiae bacterium]